VPNLSPSILTIDEQRLILCVPAGDVRQTEKLPGLVSGNFSCEMAAGACYVPVQIEMKPVDRFLAGLGRAA